MVLRGAKDTQKNLTVAPPHSQTVNVSLGKAPIEPTGNNDDPDTVDMDDNTLEIQEEALTNNAGFGLINKR